MSSHASPLRRLILSLATASALALALLWSAPAQAQIKEPGNHPDYSVELEPHLLLQWSYRLVGTDGYGLGARANIPFLKNGPISSINNNMAIGFGLDWAHFSGNGYNCWYWAYRPGPGFAIPTNNCTGNDFWVPVVLQWNFFLTKIISVFGEPGLAIEHSTWTYKGFCNNTFTNTCDYDYSDTTVQPVFWGGARFQFSDVVGVTVRIGTPYIAAGVNFLL